MVNIRKELILVVDCRRLIILVLVWLHVLEMYRFNIVDRERLRMQNGQRFECVVGKWTRLQIG
jgi:hypothetical protein